MDFETAVETVKILVQKPTNDEMLLLYGLFKQSTVGNINTECPSMFSFTERAKWNAWNQARCDEPKPKYIELVRTLIAKYGVNSPIASV